MTNVRERRISPAELHLVALRCPNCDVEITVDFASEKQGSRLFSAGDDPPNCVCGQTFDRYVLDALRAFRTMREKLAATKVEMVFRIPEPTTQS
jgi:hypothetical protein